MSDRWKLDCWKCNRTVELEAGPVNQPETRTCPHCGAELELRWRPTDGQ
jgi:rRNA maturation endonuclease Nob1